MAPRRDAKQQDGLFGQAAFQPRTYTCDVCGQSACYGLTWPLAPSDQWFCRRCIPVGFLPQQRSVAA